MSLQQGGGGVQHVRDLVKVRVGVRVGVGFRVKGQGLGIRVRVRASMCVTSTSEKRSSRRLAHSRCAWSVGQWVSG